METYNIYIVNTVTGEKTLSRSGVEKKDLGYTLAMVHNYEANKLAKVTHELRK